jgi:hypothetical protein
LFNVKNRNIKQQNKKYASTENTGTGTKGIRAPEIFLHFLKQQASVFYWREKKSQFCKF